MKKLLINVLFASLFGMVASLTLGTLYLNSRNGWAISVCSVLFMIFAIIAIGSKIYMDCIEENERQTAKQKIMTALADAVEKIHGTKDEFIQTHGFETYRFMLEKGFIHELLQSTNYWEVTAHGLRTFEHQQNS